MLVQRNPLFVLPSKIENERSKALIIKKTDRTTVSELKRTIANMQEIPDTDRTTVSELKELLPTCKKYLTLIHISWALIMIGIRC